MSTKRERIAVLSMNIFTRPEGIHSGKWFGSGDHKSLRISILLQKMRNFDIVILQEMFQVGVRQHHFLCEAYELGFRYHAGSVWAPLTSRVLIDGGLLILSRYPITTRGQHVFTVGDGADGACAKGALYARIQFSQHADDAMHIFTTHTQAGDHIHDWSIRLTQIHEFKEFIQHMVEKESHLGVFITGDFNVDARHNIEHCPSTGKIVASIPCPESHIYQKIVQELKTALLSDREIVDLIKQCAKTKDLHPITNGEGHGCLRHTQDPLSPGKDGKCIDYIFYSPRIGPATAKGICILSEKTDVDYGDIASIIDSHEEVSRLPITHLSDHYGLRTELELEINDSILPNSNSKLWEILQAQYPPSSFAEKSRWLWQLKLYLSLAMMASTITSTIYVVYTTIFQIFLSSNE